MTAPTPATITPTRQQDAAAVGAIFNTMQNYLQSLCHEGEEEGKLILTEAINDARKKLQEASYWAIQHVLMNGLPPAKAAPPTPSEGANDTPAPLGVVDPPQTIPAGNTEAI